MTENDSIVRVAFEAGQLKRTPRSGWLLAGIASPESVAEHSHRVAVLAYIIAVQEGADADRACTLGVFHDFPEARTGDVPSVGKSYVSTTEPADVLADQVAGVPAGLSERLVALVSEHESAKTAASTLEARCSRDADKIECLLQAREYEVQTGNRQLQPWIESMLHAVATPTGVELAKRAAELEPSMWFQEFAARFGTT